jgi:hypothetical protein
MAYDAPSYLQYGQPDFNVEPSPMSPNQPMYHVPGDDWRGKMSGQASLDKSILHGNVKRALQCSRDFIRGLVWKLCSSVIAI